MYVLYLEPYLDTINKTYKKIITINNNPDGPLKNYVKHFNAPKLSPFKSNENQSCKYGIISFLDNNEFMTVNETSELFSYLISNGYTIDTTITSMMQNSDIKLDNKLLCYISYS